MSYDVERVRKDFPILERKVNGRPLVYLDNAASSQKPRAVLDAMERYYTTSHANVHRGVHTLSVEATEAYEGARAKLARFVGAASVREIVFVRGTTEAINLVAQAHVRPRVGPGDEILISYLEHHSNIVPWQMVCEQTGAKLEVAAIDDAGDIDLDDYQRKLGPRTRFVALSHVSNALGTINPVERMIALARERGVAVLLDGAQAVPHLAVDVQALGCDFYAFSGHKMYGPTGIGVLWGRLDRLEETGPWQGGGEMILSVRFDETRYNKVPAKFEAGTPAIAGAVGLGAAADYLRGLGLADVAAYEHELLAFATERVREIPGVRLVGTARHKAGVLSFVMDGIHPHDVGTILDQEGVAVRAGHHCAQPVMERYGIAATTRASFAIYNTRDEIERLVAGLRRVREIFEG
jgi:cysteine desulfurase / selenocysteine lyase